MKKIIVCLFGLIMFIQLPVIHVNAAPDFKNKNDISIIQCKDGGYIIVEKRSDPLYTDKPAKAAHIDQISHFHQNL